MTHPRQYLLLMFIYLTLVSIVLGFVYVPLESAFMENWGFSLLIVAVLLIGIGINMHQVLRLEPEVNWIQMFCTGEIELENIPKKRMVAYQRNRRI